MRMAEILGSSSLEGMQVGGGTAKNAGEEQRERQEAPGKAGESDARSGERQERPAAVHLGSVWSVSSDCFTNCPVSDSFPTFTS